MADQEIWNDADSDEHCNKKIGSHFEENWFTHRKYKSWIAYGSTFKKAYCTYCSFEFAANRGSVLKHFRSQNHIDSTKACESHLKVIDVRCNANVPLDIQDIDDMANIIGDYTIVEELEGIIANFVNQEKGLLFPTHVMANFVAALAHCPSRDAVVILGSKSQMMMENKDAITKFSGLALVVQPTLLDGSFEMPRVHGPNPVVETPGLVCVESAHFIMGGTIPTVTWLNQVADFCELYNFKCHFDGTRLLHAVTATDIPPASFTKGYDSVTMSIAKGLGAPTGAILCGNKAFIECATRIRDEFGGRMSQPGMIAAIAMKNLTNFKLSLRTAHQIALNIELKITLIENSIYNVGICEIATNVVRLQFDKTQANTQMFTEAIARVSENDDKDSSILATRIDDSNVILEIHPKISTAQVSRICRKVASILSNVCQQEDETDVSIEIID